MLTFYLMCISRSSLVCGGRGMKRGSLCRKTTSRGRWFAFCGVACCSLGCQSRDLELRPRMETDFAETDVTLEYPPIHPVMVLDESTGEVLPARILSVSDHYESDRFGVPVDGSLLFEFKGAGAHAWLRQHKRPEPNNRTHPDPLEARAHADCTGFVGYLRHYGLFSLTLPMVLGDAMHITPLGGRFPQVRGTLYGVGPNGECAGWTAPTFQAFRVSDLVEVKLERAFGWREPSPATLVRGDLYEDCEGQGWQVRRASPEDQPQHRFGPAGALDASGVLWQRVDDEGHLIPTGFRPRPRVFLNADCAGEEFVAHVQGHNIAYWIEEGSQGVARAVYWSPDDGHGQLAVDTWVAGPDGCEWYGALSGARTDKQYSVRVMPLADARTPTGPLSLQRRPLSAIWLEPPADLSHHGRCVRARFGWADRFGNIVARTEGMPVFLDEQGRLWDIDLNTGRPSSPTTSGAFFPMEACQGDALVGVLPPDVPPYFTGGQVLRVDGVYRVVNPHAPRFPVRSGRWTDGRCSTLNDGREFPRLEDFPIVPEDEIPTFEFAVPFHPVPLDP